MRSGKRLLLGSILLTFVALQASGQSRRPAHRVPPPPRGNSITVVNHTAQRVIEAYASLTSDTVWGDERLGDAAISPGASRTLALRPATDCSYQLHVVYENTASEDGTVEGCGAKMITFDGTQAPGALSGSHDVVLTNQSGQKVQAIYLATSRENNWRSDRNHWGHDGLGDDLLAVGESKTLPVLGCSADLRIVYAGHAADEREDIDVCENPTITIAPGWNLRDPVGAVAAAVPSGAAADGKASVTVVNKTGKTIRDLYVYPDGGEEHGHELLGAGMLEDGATKTVSVAMGTTCKFTLETSSSSIGTRTRGGIDLCARKDIAITASGHPEASFRNAGPLPVVALHVDAPGAPQGPDRLADGVVARGGVLTLVLPDEGRCDYQVTAVFRDGRTVACSSDLCGGEVVLN